MSASVPIDKALGKAMRQQRKEMGYTQEEVAINAHITVAAYARVERGDANPTWTTVRAIAQGLRTSVSALDERALSYRIRKVSNDRHVHRT